MSYVGKHFYVLVGTETTYGTAVTADKDLGLIQNLTWSDENSLRREFGASQRNPVQITAGKFVSTATLEFLFQHGRILEYVLGSVAHDTANNPDIKHTFTEADALPSMTLEDGYNSTADSVFKYAGVKVGSCTFALALDGSLTVRADLQAKTLSTSTSAGSASVSTLATFPDYFGTVQTGTASSETTRSKVQSCEVTFRNDLEALHGTGSRLLQDLQANERHYEFTFSMAFDNTQEYGQFLAGATSSTSPATQSTPALDSIIFNITNGITAGSGLRQFYVNFTNATYQLSRRPATYRGHIFADFTGWARTLNSCYVYDNITTGNW